MRTFAAIDWVIIVGYLALAVTVGVLVARRASTSLESYFVADRSLPWWWLGTSMAATTFAADTPLVVVGIIAASGVAGNWFWWSWAISHVSLAVVFAALWRRSMVLTDAELVELRYAGRPAAFLRGFKAGFFALLINGIVLGWVIRAMTKIATPFVPWDTWLGPTRWEALEQVWPSWLLVGGVSDTLTVLVLFALIALYSSLGGIRGVILTDLVQFLLALGGSVLFAWLAVSHVGGLGALKVGLASHHPDVNGLLAFFPRRGAVWLPLHVLAIFLAVQWWAQYFADGSGYLAQRVNTARNERHATAGSLWFCVANFGLRTWPWVLIGLVALLLYPIGLEPVTAAEHLVAQDREMAYPVLMSDLLPAGLLGLLFVGLLAAFMSTVDTHLNWGASYLVNDVYLRFIRPQAGVRELLRVSRAAVIGLAMLAVIVAGQISSIEQAWKFFIALGAGLGLPSMLRWLWWRVNAWTEIVGMVTATASAVVLYGFYPQIRDEYIIAAVALIGATAALIATACTRPEPRAHLERFVARVRPPGVWPGFPKAAPRRTLGWLALAWVMGNTGVFATLFGLGSIVLGTPVSGVALLLTGSAALWLTLRATERARLR